MFINRISSYNKKPVGFGSHYTNVDIGASSKYGSLKICAIDEKTNEVIAKERINVFDKDESRSEDSFENNIAKKVADFEQRHNKKITKHDSDNETKLTVCYPGACIKTDNGIGFLMTNFYYDDIRLERFKRPINPNSIDLALKSNGISLIQSRHANDMAGAGACFLNKLQEKYPDVLKEGEEILYIYPGGGLGTGMIIVDKDNIKVRPSEFQHIRKYGTNNTSTEKEANAPYLRKKMESELNLRNNEIGENTKAVTDYKEFIKTVGYIDKDTYDEAQKQTILKFTESVAQLTASKICESNTKTVVLAGPIANGIRNAVNNNDKFDIKTNNGDKFTELLKQKVWESLTEIGQKLLGEKDNLNFIFLTITDNTEGAHLLQKGEAVGRPPVWYNIKK